MVVMCSIGPCAPSNLFDKLPDTTNPLRVKFSVLCACGYLVENPLRVWVQFQRARTKPSVSCFIGALCSLVSFVCSIGPYALCKLCENIWFWKSTSRCEFRLRRDCNLVETCDGSSYRLLKIHYEFEFSRLCASVTGLSDGQIWQSLKLGAMF